MMTDAEQQELKEQNAELLREKAAADAKLREHILTSLDFLTKEVHAIRISMSEMPQVRANQQSQADRIRSLEDRWIIIVAAWVITIIGFILYVKWKLP